MKHVIGLDIGGTKISGVVWDGKKVVEELTIVTPKNLFEFERNLIKLADFLSAKNKIAAVGIGMAGSIDAKKGKVDVSPNIKFATKLNLPKLFKENGYKKVKLDNDANCFTRAELHMGQGKDYKNFLALTLGTGIGGGIVINKKLYRGKGNLGAEFGHVVTKSGFVEADYQKLRDAKNFVKAGKVVGRAMASLVNIFEPEAIIIGGSYGHNESRKYLPPAKKEMQKFILDKKATVKIVISQLKNAGAIGAALLFK